MLVSSVAQKYLATSENTHTHCENLLTWFSGIIVWASCMHLGSFEISIV